MKLSVHILIAAAWLFLVAWVASAEEASVLLERGVYTQETLGDPSAAIPIYEQVLAETQADRQVTARAHFHLAICYRDLKQDAKARELLKQFLQRYEDQEALVAKARPILEELTEFDPATLMPPDTLVYVELGSPGAQLEKVLKMLEGTPFANPLAAIPTQTQPGAEPPATQPQTGEVYPGPAPGTPTQVFQALLNPSMIKEFKKLRSAAAGMGDFGGGGLPRAVAVLRPGESDAIRGILTAVLMTTGQPAPPIEGMQVVRFEDDAACAFDDEVFILAAPPSQLEWSVRQYHGATEASLATAESSFAALAPVTSRRHDALTVWADPVRCLEAARPMIGQGGMRELGIAAALADVPNMEGAVGRLRLMDDGLVIEASLAYKETHRSVLYDLIRTPPMSGAALAAVPQRAAAVAGIALQPPGVAAEPAPTSDEPRAEITRRITGLDLGRELFGNIQEIALFLDSPGEAAAGPGGGSTSYREFAIRSLGVVIVSRDPVQTQAVLDRLLALPGTLAGQATAQPAGDRTEYDLVASKPGSLTAYLAQEGHTTVLAFDQKVRDAAMEALRSGNSARTAGPLAQALAKAQGRSKVLVVSVGGILGLIDAATSAPPATQPAGTEASAPPAPSTLAQLAAALADTTARLETTEQDDTLTARITVAGVPPLREVFPLVMQLQKERAAYVRVARAGAKAQQVPPKMLRRTADKFVGALGRRDQAGIGELILPGSAAEGKVSDILTQGDFSTFRVREVRRNGPQGVAVALDDPPPGRAPVGTLIIELRMIEESVWRVTELNYVPLVPSQPMTRVEAEAEQVPPKTLHRTAEKFVKALGRRDQAGIKELILPGSAAEKKVSNVLMQADFSTFRAREVRRNGPQGVTVALDDPPPGRAPVGTLVIELRMIEESVWRVTELNYVPLVPSQPTTQPSTRPAADIRMSSPGNFEIHVKGADLRGVLHLLSSLERKSIIATKEVTGPVTADLYEVGFRQALEALLTSRGFVYREKDGIISVYTSEQLVEVLKAERMGRKAEVVPGPLVQPSPAPAEAPSTGEDW